MHRIELNLEVISFRMIQDYNISCAGPGLLKFLPLVSVEEISLLKSNLGLAISYLIADVTSATHPRGPC